MKYIFQLIILFFSLSIAGQEIQIRLIYQGIFNVKKYDDKINGPHVSKDEKQRLLNWIDTAKDLTEKTYIFELNRYESIFKEEEKLSLDTKAVPSINTANEVYYKNLSENKFIKKTSLTGKRYLVTDTLETFDWHLSQETKKIGKYNCYKATYIFKGMRQERKEHKDGTFETILRDTDFLFTAWYTMEIPIGNGPDRFGGLPGLILEMDFYDTSKWVCTEIEINPTNGFKIKAPTGGKKVTLDEYEKDIGLRK